jgi:glycosyltransferase involved in cell wall biosynthesis
MKVLWINDEANFSGGAETYIYQTAQELWKRHDVQNILLYNVESRIDYKYSKAFSFCSVLASLKQQLSSIKPDIIFVHQVSDIEILKQLSKVEIPVIGFIHDHKHFCPREHKYTTIGNKTCTKSIGANCYSCLGFINKKREFPYISINTVSNVRAVQNILKKFHHIAVASEYMKEHLLLHGFKDEKISKIALFSEPANNVEFNNSDSNIKRFLFVGQLVRGKGVDTLLEAFSRVKKEEVKLDICGDGKQRGELEEMTKALKISSMVKFHGKVAPNELSKYYLDAYAVIVPSRAPETFNLVGLEAMKHAKAVIATDVGGIGEWLKDGENGFTFPSNDDTRLASLLALSIKTPKMIKQMGEQGLANYNKKFIPQIHCDEVYNLFKSYLKKDSYAV